MLNYQGKKRIQYKVVRIKKDKRPKVHIITINVLCIVIDKHSKFFKI